MSEIKVDRIKYQHIHAGYVVVCLDENNPVLATHRLFEAEAEAVEYARSVAPSRRPAVFELRKEQPFDWGVAQRARLV